MEDMTPEEIAQIKEMNKKLALFLLGIAPWVLSYCAVIVFFAPGWLAIVNGLAAFLAFFAAGRTMS
jgi:hypothetical protein